MNQYQQDAELLKNVLSITREPVGVRFFKKGEVLPEDYVSNKKMRYCQALMEASEGKKVILSGENIACAAAGAAFGFRPLHPKLASGEGHYNVGTYGTQEAAKKVMTDMPRLPQEEYAYVALAPLAEVDYEPHVVVFEAEPERLMWIGLASMYETGERLQVSTSVVQATCVDATVVPFKTQKLNFALGCTGCREASNIDNTEAVMGIPMVQLATVIQNLKRLAEKVIPQNRSKLVYERYKEKQ